MTVDNRPPDFSPPIAANQSPPAATSPTAGGDAPPSFEGVYVDPNEPTEMGAPPVFQSIFMPNLYKGMIEGATFLFDIPILATNYVLRKGAEAVGSDAFQGKPVTLGDIGRTAFEAVPLPGFSATPRAPRTASERAAGDLAYITGGAFTFPAALGSKLAYGTLSGPAKELEPAKQLLNDASSRNLLSNEATSTVKKALQGTKNAGIALNNAGKEYATTFARGLGTSPIRTTGKELLIGGTAGVGFATPEFFADENAKISFDIAGEEVDIKPTLKVLASLGLPIALQHTPSGFMIAADKAKIAPLLNYVRDKGRVFTRSLLSGFSEQGQTDMASRILMEMSADPDFLQNVFLPAVESGAFRSPGKSTPIQILEDGTVIPAQGGLNADTIQALRQLGLEDTRLAQLDQILKGRGNNLQGRVAEENRRAKTLDEMFDLLRTRVEPGNEADALATIEKARIRLEDDALANVENAARTADEIYKILQPQIGDSQASEIAVGILRQAEERSKGISSQLWSKENIGTDQVDASSLGDWALGRIQDISRAGTLRQGVGFLYKLAGKERLNSIGIGKSGEPTIPQEQLANVSDEMGRPLTSASVSERGILDVFGEAGTLYASPATIPEVQNVRSQLSSNARAARRAGNDQLAKDLEDAIDHIDDVVLTEENLIFTGEAAQREAKFIQDKIDFLEKRIPAIQQEQLDLMTTLGNSPQARLDPAVTRLSRQKAALEEELDSYIKLRDKQAPLEGTARGASATSLRNLKIARAYTYDQKNNRFGPNTIIGKVLRQPQLLDSEFLKKVIQPGPGAGARVEEWRNAINEPQRPADGETTWTRDPEASLVASDNPNVIEAELLRRFAESVPYGKVTERNVANFVRRYKGAIEKIPGLMEKFSDLATAQAGVDAVSEKIIVPSRESILKAAASGGTIEDVQRAYRLRQADLTDTRLRNTASEYLNADVDAAALNFLNKVKSNPKKAESLADDIDNLLRTDETGAAEAGFRAAIWRSLRDTSRRRNSDGDVVPGINTAALRESTEQLRPVLNRFFTKDQIEFLDELVKGGSIQRTGADVETAAFSGDELSTTRQSFGTQEAVALAGRTAGQKFFGFFGINPLVATGQGRRIAAYTFSQLGEDKIYKIIEDALRDPVKAASLIRRYKEIGPISPPKETLQVADEIIADPTGAAQTAGRASISKLKDVADSIGNYLSDYSSSAIQRAVRLGLIPAQAESRKMDVETDYQLGPPYMYEENRVRGNIEENQGLRITVPPPPPNLGPITEAVPEPRPTRQLAQSMMPTPNPASALGQVSPVQPLPQQTAAASPETMQRGQQIFGANDPIFAKSGGIMSVRAKPRQMVG